MNLGAIALRTLDGRKWYFAALKITDIWLAL